MCEKQEPAVTFFTSEVSCSCTWNSYILVLLYFSFKKKKKKTRTSSDGVWRQFFARLAQKRKLSFSIFWLHCDREIMSPKVVGTGKTSSADQHARFGRPCKSRFSLELIFLLYNVWVRATSHFPLQPVTLVSFLTATSLHWRNRWTNSANLLTWRSGGSVQSDSIFLLKPPKLSFLLGLRIVMLVLLALLDKIQRVINRSARFIFKAPKSVHITHLLYDLTGYHHWVQYKIAVICFSVISDTAPP